MRKLNDPFYEPLRSWLEEIQKDLATQEAQLREKLDEQTLSHKNELASINEANAKYNSQIAAENENLKQEIARISAELLFQKEAVKQREADYTNQISKLQTKLDIQNNEFQSTINETETKFNKKLAQLKSENEISAREASEAKAALRMQLNISEKLTNDLTKQREIARLQAQDYKETMTDIEASFQKKAVSFSIEAEKFKAQIALLTEQKNAQAQEIKNLQIVVSNQSTQLSFMEAEFKKNLNETTIELQNKAQILANENNRLKSEILALTQNIKVYSQKSSEAQHWIDSLIKTNAAKDAEIKKNQAVVFELKAVSDKIHQDYTRKLNREKQMALEAEQKMLEERASKDLLEEKFAATERELRVYKNQLRTIGECMKDISEITAKPKEVAENIETAQTLKALIAEERAVFDRVTKELKDKLKAVEQERLAPNLIQSQSASPTRSSTLSVEEIERHIRNQRR